MPPALVIGARSVYEIVDTSDMADLIGIVFSPGGFARLRVRCGPPFQQPEVALDSIWGQCSAQTLARPPARDLTLRKRRLQCLEQFLCARFTSRLERRPRPSQIQFALRYFAHNPSIASVARNRAPDRLERAPLLAGLSRRGGTHTQGLVPHPAFPARRPPAAFRRRHPLGRAGPRLRLLRPVPLRQRVPRLLRRRRHHLLRHAAPSGPTTSAPTESRSCPISDSSKMTMRTPVPFCGR